MCSTRHRWTREENQEVLFCYYSSRPEDRGYRSRLYSVWSERNPAFPVANITEQRLADQALSLLRRKAFSQLELDTIKRSVVSSNVEGCVNQSSRDITSVEECTQSSSEPSVAPSPPSISIDQDSETDDVSGKSTALSSQQNSLQIEILEKLQSSLPKVRLPRVPYNSHTKSLLSDANIAVHGIATRDITETRDLIYATACVITERLGIKFGRPSTDAQNEPPWKIRLIRKLDVCRKHLGQLLALSKGRLKNVNIIQSLSSMYNLQSARLSEVIERLKQQVIALSKKLERYVKRCNRYSQNKLFVANQKQLFSLLNGEDKSGSAVLPDKELTLQFWRSIWSIERNHNTSAEWLSDVRSIIGQEISCQSDFKVSVRSVGQVCKQLRNWAAPGKDEVHGFWIKHLPSLHNRLAHHYNSIIKDSIPGWMTEGRTLLILKDAKKGPIPSNYRPITCLPVLWKVLSSIICHHVYGHLERNQLILFEQKGCKRSSRGTTDQLLIDKMVLRDAKLHKKNLEMMFIDYRKAYDSVPHSWILECLETLRVSPLVVSFIKHSMSCWKTELHINRTVLGSLDIKCGIFQGDALSPLLFVISLLPLTLLLRKESMWYRLKDGQRINHLLYMDDLKLYARNSNELTSLMHCVRIFSDNICMSFGVEKCARVSVHRGKLKESEILCLPDGQSIRSLEYGESYKYLGVLQSNDVHHHDAMLRIQKEYIRRVKAILKSQLNSRHMFLAINLYAVPVIRYAAGVLKWTKSCSNELDRKTRKLLCLHRGLHPRADVDRLYIPRRIGGRGLRSVEDVIAEERCAVYQYVLNSIEPLLISVKNSGMLTTEEKLKDFKDRTLADRLAAYSNKPLHGYFFKSCTSIIDQSTSFKWLTHGDLSVESEGFLIAAQDQALTTRAIQHLFSSTQSPKCRLCGENDETIQHLVSGCSVLAGGSYKLRHDKVASNVHWHLCGKYGLERSTNWWEHAPEAVLENSVVKILWDFNIYTDHIIHARRPDIVVVDKSLSTVNLIDISIPADPRITIKEDEKIEKYGDLRIELERLWNMKTFVIPIVIGSLGCVSKRFDFFCKLIGLPSLNTYVLQKTVLLQTVRILRRTLQLFGSG